MIDWIVAHWADLLIGASGIVAGSSVALHAIAPLTKTDKDDRAASWLDKVSAVLSKLSLNKKLP